jgi:predicted dehydrogenase
VLTTLKPLRPNPAFVLSEAPDHPVLGVALVGYTNLSKRSVMDIYNNHGCLVRWIVEDDAHLVASAKEDIVKLGLEDVQVVGYNRYCDVLNDRFTRVVIIAGSQKARQTSAEAALKKGKNVLCDRPVGMTVQSVMDMFALARDNQTIFMPMLPGRPGKAFSAVVMSLFASASKIACQRHLPDDFDVAQPEVPLDDEACKLLLADVAMHDIFAVNFSICMRPLSVFAKRISGSQAHCFEVQVTYPNRCVYTVKAGFGQHDLDTQLFKLTGDSLVDMRRVDHMSHVSINAHSANTSFNEVASHSVPYAHNLSLSHIIHYPYPYIYMHTYITCIPPSGNADTYARAHTHTHTDTRMAGQASKGDEGKTLRFTQEYDAARADALEQVPAPLVPAPLLDQ